MSVSVTMPQLGESVVEGTIGKWLVREGQRIEKDQPVVEILTDKADSEINAPESGVVTKIVAAEGATVGVGDAADLADPLPGRLGTAVADVVGDRAVEQEVVLENDAELRVTCPDHETA